MAFYAENRKARFNYEITDTLSVGAELLGAEVKAVRLGRINLAGSYAVIKNGEVWLLNAEISPYQPNNPGSIFESKRTRRLLLSKKDIAELAVKTDHTGISIIPLNIHDSHGLIKISLGLGRPKKLYDKRETIKKHDISREINRKIK